MGQISPLPTWVDDVIYWIMSQVRQLWRDGRVVDCSGLENRSPQGPEVRILLSPPYKKD